MSFGEHLSHAWYSKKRWPLIFIPLSKLAAVIIKRRRQQFLSHGPAWKSPVPVIVVGNITVGGTGKTPLVQSLVTHLISWGYHPGIISRGYGGTSDHYPLRVTSGTPANQCGDEPLMLAQSTQCPVFVDPDRCQAAQALLLDGNVDIIVSDDGLQHYRLDRDIEIVVLDGSRGIGNGWLLPAGPLREPATRLAEVDYVVINGTDSVSEAPSACHMSLAPLKLVNLLDNRTILPIDIASSFAGQKIHAVAGIGNPGRFFSTLTQLGLDVEAHPFADHHAFSKADISFDGPTVMTEKDAVKCYPFATSNLWYLKVGAELPDTMFTSLRKHLQRLSGAPVNG